MKGIGLVFAGGGGKGAYQIGVWKYLHELGLDQYVRAVSGTSVGALNAALFVGSNYESAEQLWLNIEPQQILTPKEISAEDIRKWMLDKGIVTGNSLFAGALSGMYSVATEVVAPMANQLLMHWQGNHLFSRKGITKLIEKGVDFRKIRASNLPCYATCLELPFFQVQRFMLNDYDDETAKMLLLASSAIPIVFKNEKINGKEYCDGGVPVVGDNVPVQPVYETGVENIIVIHLDREGTLDRSLYPNANIIEVIPQSDLGGPLTGTLDFTSTGSSWRIEQGYQDIERVFGPMIETLKLNAINQQILMKAQRRQDEFEQKRKSLYQKENALKQKKSTDGFDTIYQELMEGK